MQMAPAVVFHIQAINAVALAYLLGSIPFSLLIGKLWKKDPARLGSGNIGAVNTFRHISPLAGLLSFFCDAGKGYLAVLLAAHAAPGWLAPLLAACAVVAGHNWMLFLKFRGGKGLAASLGAMLAFSPGGILVILAVMILLALLLRDTNTAAAFGMVALPLYLYFVFEGAAFWGGALWAMMVIAKFWPDILAYRRGRRRLI